MLIELGSLEIYIYTIQWALLEFYKYGLEFFFGTRVNL